MPTLSRPIRSFEADPTTEKLIATWHDTHIAERVAGFDNELARSAVVLVFEQLDADLIRSGYHGTIARQQRKGEVDYKALALAELGEQHVTAVAESYRKPPSRPVTAPSGWSAEAGLARSY